MGIGLLSVVVLVLANAFFVAAEFALVRVRESRIQQLEQELETRLFLREPSGYVRTSAGERLMARAEALEQEIFACQETVADETAVAG